MLKHTLKVLEHLLQDFQRMSDHSVDTRHYWAKFTIIW